MTSQDPVHDQEGQAILALLRETPTPASIAMVVEVMQALDGTLSSDDGVKWFNLLYLLVTRAVYQSPPAGGWADERWLTQLDLTFAQLYFDALAQWYTSPATVARAWAVLFASRFQQGIERVQFALAGMNAHINHDLPLAVVQTCSALQVAPERDSPEYRDYQAVNGLLDRVEPEALTHLATGLAGVVAQDLGTVGHLLSMWSVYAARDTAWTNADLLWQLRDLPAARDGLLLVLDRMTGFAGRGLLAPVSHLVQGGG